MRIKTKAMFLIMLFCGIITSNAQESFNSSGGDASSNDGSVSYSIGQVFISATNTGSEIIIEGVQQPYEISIHTGIEEDRIDLQLIAYPNPTNNVLHIKIQEGFEQNLKCNLLNINGQIIIADELISATKSISMAHLSSATYFLQISNKKGILKSYKIIKK